MGHMLGISDVMMTDLLHLPRLMSRLLAYLLAFLARWHLLASQNFSEGKIRQLWLTNQPATATVATSGGNSAYQKFGVRSYDAASTWVPQKFPQFRQATKRVSSSEDLYLGRWNHETYHSPKQQITYNPPIWILYGFIWFYIHHIECFIWIVLGNFLFNNFSLMAPLKKTGRFAIQT